MASISLKNIVKQFGEVTVVDKLNLEVAEGEFIVLVGASGCGKSTTLRMIAGLETPTSGAIHIGDHDVTEAPPAERDIAMVFQNYALYPHMDVAQNMSFSLRLAKVSDDEITARVNEAARILSIEHLLRRKPKELSGGQRQRGDGARHRARAEGVPVRRTAVQPGRQAARPDAGGAGAAARAAEENGDLCHP